MESIENQASLTRPEIDKANKGYPAGPAAMGPGSLCSGICKAISHLMCRKLQIWQFAYRTTRLSTERMSHLLTLWTTVTGCKSTILGQIVKFLCARIQITQLLPAFKQILCACTHACTHSYSLRSSRILLQAHIPPIKIVPRECTA